MRFFFLTLIIALVTVVMGLPQLDGLKIEVLKEVRQNKWALDVQIY